MAPRRDLLTPKGLEFIGELPPFLRNDPTYRAVLHCIAKEAERADAKLQDLRRELNPVTAGAVGLGFYESLLLVPSSAGQPLVVRRSLIIARLRSLQGDPSGAAWEDRITARIGDIGWSYLEWEEGAAEPTGPQVLRIFLPYPVASPSWSFAEFVFREETPSEIELEFVSTQGFIWDVSHWDVDQFNE